MAQCEIAQDRSGVNYGIVVFSGILEGIWDNRFSVHHPSVFKVKPIDPGSETPFVQTPFGLIYHDGGFIRRKKRNSGGELDNRVSNDNADKDLKMIQIEDWENVLCGSNAIHRIKWNNNGCLMCPC